MSTWKILFFCWLLANIIYSVIASFSRVLYFRQTTSSLSLPEIKVSNGEASLKDRGFVFIGSFIGGIFAPQVYLLAFIFVVLTILIIKFV